METIDKIKKEIEKAFEIGGYKLNDTHFENGRNLHSEQYYYAKRFFQNSENCNYISELLCKKLTELNLPDSTTLIGYRNYTELLLNKTKEINRYNYAIIEYENDTFIWQNSPKFNNNLLIILPITCTCSTYIKLRKFLEDEIKKPQHNKANEEITVNVNFINVFLILEETLKKRATETINLRELNENNKDIYYLYSAFNWVEINESQILFKKTGSSNYIANPLIRLYSKMYLPESCPLCFPSSNESISEKPLLPTHDNYETPNLIFGLPNFNERKSDNSFFKYFDSFDNNEKIHLYGHIEIDGCNYLNYIVGYAFYNKNRDEIKSFFYNELKKRITNNDENIIFITAENKHNSSFLEDISLFDFLSNKSITILRFRPSNEFIDNFISLHSKVIEGKGVKVIYFEEVISNGRTFKLISDYIKHSRTKKGNVVLIHGFDLIMTLVNRMPLYTLYEIYKKIYSKENSENPKDDFIAFFNLNVPIISATHLGNPLKRRVRDMNRMIEQSHLDFLKIIIGKEVKKQLPRSLPELGQI